MNKIPYILIAFVLTLFGLFAFLPRAEASVYGSQLTDTELVTIGATTLNTQLMVSSTASGGDEFWIALDLSRGSSPSCTNWSISVREYAGPGYTNELSNRGFAEEIRNASGTLLATSTFMLEIPRGKYAFRFNVTSTAFVAGHYYQFSYNDDNCGGGTYIEAYGADPYTVSQALYHVLADSYQDALGLPETSVEIKFPEANTTSTAHQDFSNWVIGINNVTSTETYIVTIDYSLQSSTMPIAENYYVSHQDSTSFTGLSDTTGWAFPKTYNLTPPSTDTTIYQWTAVARLFAGNNFNPFLSQPITSASTTFYTMFNGTTPTSSSALLAGPWFSSTTPSVASSTDYCMKPTNILDWGGGLAYGLCAFSNKATEISDSAYEKMIGQWQQLKTTFPFSLVFGRNQTLLNEMSDASSTGGNYDLYFNAGAIREGLPNIPILTSTTMENAIGTTWKNNLFELMNYAIWLSAGYIAFKIII